MKNEFPKYVNFYSSFESPTKLELKEFLENNGWKSRKESWEDFELTNDWCELNLIADETKPLLKGTIKNPNTNYKNLINLLKKSGAKFSAELYDEENVLIYNDKI